MQSSSNPVNVKNLGLTERWVSIVGGLGLLRYGMKKRSASRALISVVGGDLIYWGVSGYSPVYKALGMRSSMPSKGKSESIPYREGVRVDKSITIDKPREEVYAFWRNLENLPKFMRHVRGVTVIDSLHSHWVADGPAGKVVEWDAEINSDEPNERIGWRSLPGSEVDTAGSVHFKRAPREEQTEVIVALQYLPPGGAIAAAVAKLFGGDPAAQVEEDLHRLKQLLETGEIATIEGQPTGAEDPLRHGRAAKPPHRRSHRDKVSQASEQSFPASDPPSTWAAPRPVS